MADGRTEVTFVYPTGGREAVELAAKILAGDKVEKKITLPTEKITKATS